MIHPIPRSAHLTRSLLAVLACITLSGCASTGASTAPSVDVSVAPGSASAPAASGAPSVGGGTAATNASPGLQTVKVELTNAGCQPVPASVPAGPTNFELTNVNANLVFEMEVKQGDHILGERENVLPGMAVTLLLNLPAGTYALHCPIAPADAAFSVTPSSVAVSGSPVPLGVLNAQAVTDYTKYVQLQVASLVSSTTLFAAAVEAGDVTKSKALYAPARVFYERIEPVAESFGNLDPEIDARINDVADPTQWTGFHRIEQALWANNTTTGMGPIAQKLVADVLMLQTLVESAIFQPDEIANGATSLLDEVSKSKITGEEERYSHIDLVDFQANVDGSQAAFTALGPSVAFVDPNLAASIRQQFSLLDAALAKYGSGSSFALYGTLSTREIRTLATGVDALADPLSKVAVAICGCR